MVEFRSKFLDLSIFLIGLLNFIFRINLDI
ncbi:hypothetical protein PITCH_A790010 [uncultured Desulfobacterium sp.]|uniref:Uncharacterized protein n=1 Tax=uncultured Desulfobacterium sp. TaxID=201089 RepID=A0A445N2S9_9BACT|nr:hypothetical protein PITCH_A790010 [uncultured Desulfobacterium sp.]